MAATSFRCELTSDRLHAGERELAAALALAAVRTQEALRRRREKLEPRLRAFGLAACALGAALSGWAVVMTPARTCAAAGARGSGHFYQVTTPLFVALGVLFWFMPRVTAEIRAWAPRAAARAAPRLLAALRKGLPSEVTYSLDAEGVTSSLSRPRRTRRTPFRMVQTAVVGMHTACLFGRPPFGRLLRVVWLPGEDERRALLLALDAARIPVVRLPDAPAAAGAV
jgi:hypothetical protein